MVRDQAGQHTDSLQLYRSNLKNIIRREKLSKYLKLIKKIIIEKLDMTK